jgi:hypothetical protein
MNLNHNIILYYSTRGKQRTRFERGLDTEVGGGIRAEFFAAQSGFITFHQFRCHVLD